MMKSIFKFALIAFPFIIFMGHHEAYAQRVSKVNAKALSSFCADSKTVKICDAYLAGIADSEVWAHDYALLEHNKNSVAFCIPAEQTTAQIRNLIVAWLGAHTDALNEPAGRAVYRALHENYPCHVEQVETKIKK